MRVDLDGAAAGAAARGTGTALAEGAPISEVSRWPGHRSITTTVDLYGHLVPGADCRAHDALDRTFADARMCPGSAPAAS